MRRFTARLRSGWLLLGLALVLVPVAQARSASDQNAGAGPNALGAGIGLTRSAQSNRQALTSAKVIRTTVRKGFVAINAANKKLFVCKWGHCTQAGKTLRTAAQHWLGQLRPLTAKTKAVGKGLSSARTALTYWARTGLDAINADAAAKAKKQSTFDYWYKRYTTHYKLGVRYQNSAVDILSKA